MDRNKVITIVANDILNKMNINQILNAVRGHCIGQAEEYYNGLTDDAREALIQQIKAAESPQETQPETQPENQEQNEAAEKTEPASV